jgi:hypothetical protein
MSDLVWLFEVRLSYVMLYQVRSGYAMLGQVISYPVISCYVRFGQINYG